MWIKLTSEGFYCEISAISPFTSQVVASFVQEHAGNKADMVIEDKQPVDPGPRVGFIPTPVKTKRAYVRHKTLNFTKERDKIIRDNFEKLGHSGIFDKSLLPGFSLAEIRQRCIELGLLDKYGLKPGTRR